MRTTQKTNLILTLLTAVLVSACGTKSQSPMTRNGAGGQPVVGNGNAVVAEWNVLKRTYQGSVSGSQSGQFSMEISEDGGFGRMSLTAASLNLTNDIHRLGYLGRTVVGSTGYYHFVSEVITNAPYAPGAQFTAYLMSLAFTYQGNQPIATAGSWLHLLECEQTQSQTYYCEDEYSGLGFSVSN